MISGVYQCYVFQTSDKNNIGIKSSFQALYLTLIPVHQGYSFLQTTGESLMIVLVVKRYICRQIYPWIEMRITSEFVLTLPKNKDKQNKIY